MASRPGNYLNWVPSDSSSYISQPSPGQQAVGFVGSQAPPFAYLNWLFYYTDQWIQYFDSVILATSFLTKTATFVVSAPTQTYFCNTAGGGFTATFAASASQPGYLAVLKNTGIGSGNNVLIAVQTGDYLEGVLNGTATLTPGDVMTFQSDGAGNYWQVNT